MVADFDFRYIKSQGSCGRPPSTESLVELSQRSSVETHQGVGSCFQVHSVPGRFQAEVVEALSLLECRSSIGNECFFQRVQYGTEKYRYCTVEVVIAQTVSSYLPLRCTIGSPLRDKQPASNFGI